MSLPNDLFGGLGGALGGLMDGIAKSGLVPKDTPEGKILSATSEVSNLEKQESALLLEIGRVAYEENPVRWPQDAKLKLIQQNLIAARNELQAAQQEQQDAQATKDAQAAMRTCPSCGHENAEGIKFCQECGTKLGLAAPKFCGSCGEEIPPGIQFCGSCGAKQV